MIAFAQGALLGARGNSGVITSQLLRGFSDVVNGAVNGTPLQASGLVEALTLASELAYGAVGEPRAGTGLTESSVAAEVTQVAAKPPVYIEDLTDADDSADDNADDSYEEELEDEDEGFRAPDQYVEREGSGRPRRIGSDVRYDDIDYKNIGLLSRFLDRRGRILSRRKTRVSAKVQRKIVREIKRARHLALLPYTADQTRIVRKRK